MSLETPESDLVWRALGSPIRRRILDILRGGKRTTTELAGLMPELSRYAVMQHLGVLVEAELVVVHREGRVRWNSLNVVPLRRTFERWITPYQAMWAGRMLDLKRRVENPGASAREEKPRATAREDKPRAGARQEKR